jgi:hypothetical protein
MRSTTSPTPTGTQKETTFMQGVSKKLKSELQFYDSTTVKVEQTTRGVRFHASRGGAKPIDGWRFAKPILYDKTKSYSFQEIVYVASDNPLVTAGTIDPDTGQTVFAFAGKYVALQAVAPVVNPTGLTAGTYYHIPQLPLPTPGDPDNAAPDSTAYGTGEAQNYWDIVTQDAQCY